MAPAITRRTLASAAAGLCLAPAARASGAIHPAPAGPPRRPYTVEDFLAHEALGPVSLSADGRWLAADWRGPRRAARAFDYDLLNDWFRTTVMVADLANGGPLRPLFAPEPATGYHAGPISPDGRRLALMRLKDDQLTLGIVTLASGEVRWLDVHPDYDLLTRSLAWTSPATLVVIAHPPGSTPWYVRAMHPWTQLPGRWARTAKGGAAVTVYGSGAQAADMAPPPPLELVQADVEIGATRRLARGAFADLEASPDGRVVAVLERAELVRWQGGGQVQGDYGVATRRQRLRLVDLASGRLTTPLPDADVMGGPLAWSPSGRQLLAYVRRDGEPWTAGRLVQAAAHGGGVRELAADLSISLARRPEVARAAWWGETPIVFARARGAPRDDWWRLTAAGPRNLTAALPPPTAETAIAGPERLLVRTADGWRAVGPDGDPVALSTGAALLRPSRHAVQDRAWSLPADASSAALVTPAPDGGLTLRPLAGHNEPLDVSAGVQVLRLDPLRGGALLAEPLGGGAQRLVWRAAGRPAAVLAALNPQDADLARPVFQAIPHRGPAGEPRTSWLLRPSRTAGAAPPPLVVWPYPGSTLAAPPAALDLTDDLGDKTPLMLAGHGYAVLLPSLPTVPSGPGPAEGLADRVLAIVEAAARQPDLAGAFDPDRLGLVGFSHGGYAVNAIVTQTGRFKAAVSAGGSSNLSSMWGVLSDPSRISPERGSGAAWMAAWTETVQGMMYAPPWAAPDRYVRNSPLFHAGAITTPLLLLQGEHDSQPHAEAERMFSALERQGKDGELVTYWGEGHILYSPGNLRDYAARIVRWLDARLKA